MKNKITFIRYIQLWVIVIIIAIGGSIIAIDIVRSYQDFNFLADQIRADYTVRQRQIIKHEVKRVVDMIYYEKMQSEILTKAKIKSRIYEACAIAQHIYQQNKTSKTKNEIQKMILDAISPIRFEQGSGYYFISRIDGVTILFPSKPEMEGLNLSDVRDSHGQYLTKDMIKIVGQSGEGFYEYHWTKPYAAGNNFKKIAFIKRFEPYDWFIGAGLYVDDVEEQIKSGLLSTISRIRFGKEGYIFINNLNGDALVSNGKIVSGTKKLWEVFNENPEKMKNIFKKEYNAALKPEGDYIYYSHIKLTDPNKESPKASFIYGIPEWQWIVGAGVYLDDVETVIARMQTELNNHIKTKMLYFALITLCIIALSLFFFSRLNRRLKNDFNLFISFFSRASLSDKPIDRDLVQFDELDRMAENANKMLSDRRQAEEALRRSEAKFRGLIESSSDLIWEVNKEGVYTYVSPQVKSILGYTPDEVVGKTLFDLMLPEEAKPMKKCFKDAAVKGKSIIAIENINLHKTGRRVVLETNGVPVLDEAGEVIGYRGMNRDITKRKQAEEEKIKAQKTSVNQKKMALVGQIAGKMAHDFNNVLGIIMGNAELSLIACKDEEIKRTLELIIEQTLRGKNLTKNLVAFAKDQEPKQEFFRLNRKIDLVVNLMRKDLDGIELLKEESPGVPDLLADPGMIEHALVNLIQNSIHATSMSEHPRIILRSYCLDENICFEIEDNGCGIAEKYLEKIYEPSFTLKGTNDVKGSYKTSIKGTGYGMANVKKYIEQHKGDISVESELGSGTKFTIRLPVIKKQLTSEEVAEIQKEIIHFEKYILLVEDETAISDVQYKILTQNPCNHKVDIANNGQVAMDLFDRNEYDFISLDYILPGNINGMDVYNHIRETNKNIPILFISGNIEFLESIKKLKQNDTCIDHLSKPCQNKDYVNSINKLLKKQIDLVN